jgi:hypothetical protein
MYKSRHCIGGTYELVTCCDPLYLQQVTYCRIETHLVFHGFLCQLILLDEDEIAWGLDLDAIGMHGVAPKSEVE